MLTAIVDQALGEPESVTFAAVVTAGDVVVLPSGFAGVVIGVGTYAIGEPVPVQTKGLIDVPVATGTTFAVGAKVEWNASTKLCVASSGTYILGCAVAAKVNGPTRMKVRLNEIQLSSTLNA